MPLTYSEAVQLLCVAAGMIMEDVSSEAVATLSDDSNERCERLDSFKISASDAAAIISAAEVLERRFVRAETSLI